MLSALTTEFQNTQKQKPIELNGETHRFIIRATDLKLVSQLIEQMDRRLLDRISENTIYFF